ncbi:golgi complex component Cog3 [Trichophyton equinum CBS 127.97]|uniref:Conserved oligomeric Golgi complex subunit 3 n=1 Tax=Trichophyton equinum (strain ATCC MYA-4606 / CBS 127.97) TaxID=559882 RepID=F2PXA8_TRIEC|nr:golgi complex component Cog3 [Trichophyton equinum CBS 127.97]
MHRSTNGEGTEQPALLAAEDALSGMKNDLEFTQWYGSVKDELLEASYEKYQSCLDDLELTTCHLDSLLQDTSHTLDILSTLSHSFEAVEDRTSAFRKQCEGLLSARNKSAKLADEIQENLTPYDYLDPISRRLNAPGAGNSVRSKDFSDMLRRLDECLDYMHAHPEQKEAEIYRARYRLLLTRALTLIRGQFVSTVRDISSGVTKRIADRQLNDTTMSALLYAKFRVGASEMKDMGLEIQKRAVPPLDPEQGAEAEYQSLLNELHVNFATSRARLVVPLVRKRLNDIANAPSTSKDLVAFARTSISYVRGICLDEFDLWGEWFHGQYGLYDFLEAICEPLYDHLRPRIIHDNKLVRLCQLCILLQTRYLNEPDEDGECVIKPRPEDLDYPAKNKQISSSAENNTAPVVSGRKSSLIESKIPIVENEDTDSPAEKESQWDFTSQAMFEGWYPTLKKAIWLLSRIYRLSKVFDDLAHQIVHQTTLSIQQAGTEISSKKSKPDGLLFLIRHLLVLKQQIVAFDMEFVSPDVSFDFSGVTNTFWELQERGGLFNTRTWMQLVGGGLLPQVVENMLDAKVELDGTLRTVINDFTNTFATKMISSLPPVSGKTITPTLSQQIQKGALTMRRSIEEEVPILRRLLDDYLEDKRTKETLVSAVQDTVTQLYEDYLEAYAAAEAGKDKPGRKVSRKPVATGELWDIERFGDWTDSIFRPKIEAYESDNGNESQDDDPDENGEYDIDSDDEDKSS